MPLSLQVPALGPQQQPPPLLYQQNPEGLVPHYVGEAIYRNQLQTVGHYGPQQPMTGVPRHPQHYQPQAQYPPPQFIAPVPLPEREYQQPKQEQFQLSNAQHPVAPVPSQQSVEVDSQPSPPELREADSSSHDEGEQKGDIGPLMEELNLRAAQKLPQPPQPPRIQLESELEPPSDMKWIKESTPVEEETIPRPPFILPTDEQLEEMTGVKIGRNPDKEYTTTTIGYHPYVFIPNDNEKVFSFVMDCS